MYFTRLKFSGYRVPFSILTPADFLIHPNYNTTIVDRIGNIDPIASSQVNMGNPQVNRKKEVKHATAGIRSKAQDSRRH